MTLSAQTHRLVRSTLGEDALQVKYFTISHHGYYEAHVSGRNVVQQEELIQLPLQGKGAGYILLYDHDTIADWAKALLASAALSHFPVVAGPKAKHLKFLWELKPQVDARGGILEIATGSPDFLARLDSVSKAAYLVAGADYVFDCRNHSRLTAEAKSIAPGLAPAPMSALDSLPGIIHAVQILRDEDGQLDANKIAELFGYTRKVLATLVGVHPETMRATPASAKLQPKLVPFEKIARLLVFNPDPANFRKWLHSPNTELGGTAPADLIAIKGPEPITLLVENLLVNRGG